MNIDKHSAFLAALVTLGVAGIVAGIVALIAWSMGPGPDWIWQAIIGIAALAAVFYAVYTLIETR